MRIRAQILLGFFAVVVLFFGLTLWIVRDVRPQPLKATEEALVDTANLLAAYLETRVRDGVMDTRDLPGVFDRAEHRSLDAQIYELRKTDMTLRVYVTGADGIVIFDSRDGELVGQDYSQWHDVYKTMRGEYGARATRTDPEDFYSTALYVGAPVYAGDEIVGVVTVSKPVESVKLFISRLSRKILWITLGVGLVALALSLLISGWITRPIGRLTAYAARVRDGRRGGPPPLGSSEVAVLGAAFEEMRDALEGKQYIEQYVQTVSHEIKSPLSSIRGAAELLLEEMPAEDRQRFLRNILTEAGRIRRLVERLLELAALESRKDLMTLEAVDLAEITREAAETLSPVMRRKDLDFENALEEPIPVQGEAFLLRRVLYNLLQNAVDFTPPGGRITVEAQKQGDRVSWVLRDGGPGVPDYALDKIYDRFYSLGRPDTGEKSTGLGLSIAREALTLLGGELTIENDPSGGTRAAVTLRN